ncbi:hypothetical protein CHELA40_30313 [Chelatococcus asaccharovorans]|nr:hypothetical protein CHELA17_40101 [Chelatococcus asaccharovorans]CAH1688830.1 hypothetical protein CHELA40_30313 [Chelatococcus asaccharovorans]
MRGALRCDVLSKTSRRAIATKRRLISRILLSSVQNAQYDDALRFCAVYDDELGTWRCELAGAFDATRPAHVWERRQLVNTTANAGDLLAGRAGVIAGDSGGVGGEVVQSPTGVDDVHQRGATAAIAVSIAA